MAQAQSRADAEAGSVLRTQPNRMRGACVNEQAGWTDEDDRSARAYAYEEYLQENKMPKVSEMIQSKFLRKEDFEEDRVMTIRGIKLEDMPGDDGTQKWVLYFKEEAKGMALNVTTIRVLEAAFGDDSDAWMGKRVMVYVDPNVSFGGRVVGGIRLRAPKKTAAPVSKATEPPQADREFDDDIPF
jgi:hypothetical protein